MSKIDAPFVWFGGKKMVADKVWQALGDVDHYVEPFFGSGAVLIRRPHAPNCETVNDADGLLANFWRAVSKAPDDVAHHAANPVNEADLHARHLWLVGNKDRITERLMGEPEWFDAKAAGWWVWGVNSWIGGGFCSGNGPWVSVDGVFTNGNTGQGVKRQLPHLGNTGKGVKRQLPHLGDTGKGVKRQLPHLGDTGQGVNRKLPHLGDTGQGVNRQLPHLGGTGQREAFLRDWFGKIKARLEGVRVACGDWTRVCGPSVLRSAGGVTGIFFDPPYDLDMRTAVYANESNCAADVMQWCIDHGNDKDLRIVLAGYDGEHNRLEDHGWRVHAWKAAGGFGGGMGGRGEANASKERLWFSPQCLDYQAQGVLL